MTGSWLLLGASSAAACDAGTDDAERGQPLLVRIREATGERLELAHGCGARRAMLLVGPALGRPARAGLGLEGLGLDGLGAIPLRLDAVGLGRWGPLELEGLVGLAAQVLVLGCDGRARFSNTVELGPTSATATGSSGGGVVITEFLADPAAVPDARGEWIELTSVAACRVDLTGWTLGDGRADLHRIEPVAGPLWIGPGERIVLANEGDPLRNGGLRPDYVYANFVLANDADSIELRDRDGNLVDGLSYGARTWPLRAGRSSAYRLAVPDAQANDDPRNWCLSSSRLPGGDAGTPSAPADPCP